MLDKKRRTGKNFDAAGWLKSNRRIDESTGCWNWTRKHDCKGYGRIIIARKQWLVSRLSWTLFKGEIPKGMHVLHHCDNPSCFNPDHLYLGTQKDNNRDRDDRNRTCIGRAHPAHKLDEFKVREIRKSDLSHSTLAKKFKVGNTIIGRVKRMESYLDVT